MEEDVKKKLRDLFDDMLTKVGDSNEKPMVMFLKKVTRFIKVFRRKSPVYAKRQKKTGVKNWWKN